MAGVLFVCVENTFRSVLSEAMFNEIAPAGWHGESAGVQAAASINPVVVPLLKEIGIHLGAKTPRLATPDLVDRASRVVTFGCLDRCPIGARGKSEDWPVPGATGRNMAQLREIRDDLHQRVGGLVSRLPAAESEPKAKPRKV